MKRSLEARAIARLERRRQRLAGQLEALVTPPLRAAILADPALAGQLSAPEVDLYGNPSTWPAGLERQVGEVFDAVVRNVGAGELVGEHDRLAARLNRYLLSSEVNEP
ncbi:MAG: hypothetical protein WA040_02530 [Anaerolineae bacterium]